MRQLQKDIESKDKDDDANDNNEDNNNDEATMKDLYKRLNLDYKLVFPEK